MNSPDRLLQRRLKSYQKAFGAGNLGAVLDALNLCCKHKRHLPEWLGIAVQQLTRDSLLGASSRKGQGRHARWLTQYKSDQIDQVRAEIVQDCVDHNIRWVDAYYAASLSLQDTFAEGNEDAIESSYKRYKRRIKREPMRYIVLSCVRFQKDLMQPYTPERAEMWQEVLSLRKS